MEESVPARDESLLRLCHIGVTFISCAVASIGFLAICGWAFDQPLLKSIRPDWVAMRMNTAICLTLVGFSLFHLRSPNVKRNFWTQVSRGAAVLIGLVGILTLIEHLFHVDVGIDNFFVPQVTAVGTLPLGRMALNTTVNFIFTSGALLLIENGSRKSLNISIILECASAKIHLRS